jgi:hypothetical protein
MRLMTMSVAVTRWVVRNLAKPVERDCAEQSDNRGRGRKTECREEGDCGVHGRKSTTGKKLPIVAVWP